MWISFGQSKDSRKSSDLEERLEKAERTLRSLDLEFSTLYGKVRAALGRIDKRASIIEAQQEPEGADGEESAAPLPAPEGVYLSPAQARLNEQILRRRLRQ